MRLYEIPRISEISFFSSIFYKYLVCSTRARALINLTMSHSLLLHLSWLYERDESRADVYPMVRYWIENNDSDSEKIRGIATLLYIWNAGYYSRARARFARMGFFIIKLGTVKVIKNKLFSGIRICSQILFCNLIIIKLI